MKCITAAILVLVSLLLISNGLKVAAATPQCTSSENCRLYCARTGTTPLCFNGVCKCYSKKITTSMKGEVAAPKCLNNENCKLYCARFGTTPLCFDGVCTCF